MIKKFLATLAPFSIMRVIELVPNLQERGLSHAFFLFYGEIRGSINSQLMMQRKSSSLVRVEAKPTICDCYRKMRKTPIYQSVTDIIEPTLKGSDIELVDVEYKKTGKTG